MSNFDIRRFAKTARWQCGMSLKSVLSFAAGLSFGYLFPMFGWLYPYLKGAEALDESRLMHSVELCTLVYLVVIIIAGTWIFADMGTKAQRIKVKMLPATDLEKYIVRWLGITLGAMVMGIVSYCVADALRMLTCLVAGVDCLQCTIPDFIRLLFTNGDDTPVNQINSAAFNQGIYFLATGWVMWAQSLYVLGGTLLRRYQFVTTTAVHIVLFLIMSIFISSSPVDVELTVRSSDNSTTFYAVGALLMAVAVANWWLSYRVFRRMQVVNNKWINL